MSDLSPIAGLKNLGQICCDDTPVSDLSPWDNVLGLEVLNLDRTKVTDLTPLANLKNLTELHVQGTPVSEEQVKLLQQALPNCKIESDFATTTVASRATDVESPKADLSQGISSLDARNYDKAIEILTGIIQVDPNSAEAFNFRAVAWKYKGEFDKMIQDCTEAIRINPKFTEAYHNRGRAWRREKRIRQGN